MRDLLRAAIGAVAALGVLATGLAAAHAAGALAVGACAAYGYAYDFPSSQAAQAAAIKKCGPSCKNIVTTRKSCAALAVDARKPCGASGYASAAKLGAAQNTALRYCYRYGGKDCVIRAFMCDAKG